MDDAFLTADFADVNHALDAFGELHKCTKLRDVRPRPFDHRSRRKLFRRAHPRITERLFQSQRHTPLPKLISGKTASAGSPPLTRSLGCRTFFVAHDISEI